MLETWRKYFTEKFNAPSKSETTNKQKETRDAREITRDEVEETQKIKTGRTRKGNDITEVERIKRLGRKREEMM